MTYVRKDHANTMIGVKRSTETADRPRPSKQTDSKQLNVKTLTASPEEHVVVVRLLDAAEGPVGDFLPGWRGGASVRRG